MRVWHTHAYKLPCVGTFVFGAVFFRVCLEVNQRQRLSVSVCLLSEPSIIFFSCCVHRPRDKSDSLYNLITRFFLSLLLEMQWTVRRRTTAQNCVDFAFNGDEDFLFKQEVSKVVRTARGKGWIETNNISLGDVILYGGSNKYFTHAIKRVGEQWEESYGNKMKMFGIAVILPGSTVGKRYVQSLWSSKTFIWSRSTTRSLKRGHDEGRKRILDWLFNM